MPSFKSLFLIGFASLTTLTSARPIHVSGDLDASVVAGIEVSTVPGLDIAAAAAANVDVDADVSVLKKRSPVSEDGGEVVPVTVPSILLDLNADLGDLLGQIQVAVSVDGTEGVAVTLNIELLTQLLEDAQNLISDATAEIVDLIANGGLGGLLNGLLSSIELGGIIATLLKTIATILSTVLTALVGQTADVASLEAVISTVTALTGQLITTVVGNVTGLAGILAPIVSTVVGVLTGLGLDCTPITDAVAGKVL